MISIANVVTGIRLLKRTAFCGPIALIAAFHVRTATKAPGIARYAICGQTDVSCAAVGASTSPVVIATSVAPAIVSHPSAAVSAV